MSDGGAFKSGDITISDISLDPNYLWHYSYAGLDFTEGKRTRPLEVTQIRTDFYRILYTDIFQESELLETNLLQENSE